MRISFDTEDVAPVERTPQGSGSLVRLEIVHYPAANDGAGLWQVNGRPMDAAASVALTVAGIVEAMERRPRAGRQRQPAPDDESPGAAA
jgi:hypothetical protein